MNQSVISDVSFLDAQVVQSTIVVSRERPCDGAEVAAELAVGMRPEDIVSEGGVWTKRVSLTISVVAHDDGPEGVERVRAFVILDGGASISRDVIPEMAQADRYLATNAVSMLYATGRTYLEMLASMTPIQRFTLPAIDPYKVVDSH